MLESQFQAKLIKELKKRFPGCIVMDEMSFSRFICPENKEEVLHDLQQSFES